ncbi:MAG: hypothetical protein ACF8PN_03975 [Phycisphaerales bacterium]
MNDPACPSALDLFDYVQESATEERRLSIGEHLNRCDRCRSLVEDEDLLDAAVREAARSSPTNEELERLDELEHELGWKIFGWTMIGKRRRR